MAWSFIAQRATTGEFLDWDVPLELGGLEWQLSGPGSLKASIEPDVGGLRASDGGMVLEEWGTLLHVEHDGVIRWSGVVISCSFSGEKWDLEAAGYSTYPHRRTYRGDFSQIGVDPAFVFRHIWEHLQSFPDGNLGVSIVGATDTGVRMGEPAHDAYTPPKIAAAQEILAQYGKRDRDATYLINDDWTWPGNYPYVSTFGPTLRAEYGGNGADSTAAEAWLQGYVDAHKAEIIEAAEAKPYELVWTESTNCGSELDDLTKLAPMDWVEKHRWTPDGEQIVHEIELSFPRAGRRRDDLVFAQGDNVTNVVTVESNGDEFANLIIGLGAGEGRAMVRRETSVRDGRLLVDHVYADKSISDTARLDAVLAEELNARKAALRVESVEVIDHPNAPIGSWQLGDDVLVRAELPWLGEVEVWCRVTGWALTGENKASLTLVRSDLYRYGGVSDVSA